MNSAEVLVKFKGNTDDLEKKSNKAKSVLKGFTTGMTAAFGVATAAVTTATVAVVNLVKQSVEAYSTFEQLEGGLISLFGNGSDEMNRILKDSEKAWQNLTMSQNDYLTSFQSAYPLVNAGLSENADAIEYTNKMLQLSSDLFNTYGGSIDYYQNAINWALKGSFVYLDNLNLGIKGTQEGFIDAANASGILGREIKNVNELTSDEIIDVIQHYAKAYGVWGKTGQEASTTILGSLNMVKATWNNFITGLSKNDADINSLIDNLVNSVITFAGNIMPVIIRALESIAKALPKVVQSLADEIPGLLESLLPPLLDAAITLVKSLSDNLPSILKIIINALLEAIGNIASILPDIVDALLQGAIAVVNALSEQLPSLMPKIVDAVLKGILTILDNYDALFNCGMQLLDAIFVGLQSALPLIIDYMPQMVELIVSAVVNNIDKFIELGVMLTVGIGAGILMELPHLIAKLPEICMAIIRGFAAPLGINSPSTVFAEMGRNLLQGLINGVSSMASAVVNKVKSLASKIINGMKSALGIHSPSTEFAILGHYSVLGYTEALEDMKNQVQSTIDSVFDLQPNINGQMSSTYSPTMVVNVQNNMEMDPLGQLVNNIKTFSGGAKNDYNWGSGL